MGVIDFVKHIFGGSKQTLLAQSYDMYAPRFSNNANPSLNDTFVSACLAHGRHGAKLQPQVNYKGMISLNKVRMNYILETRPNPVMDGPTFWERVTLDYFQMNNAFIYPEYDYKSFTEELKNLWIIPPEDLEMRISGNMIYYKFKIENQDYYASSEQMIHISRNSGHLLDAFGKTDPSINKIIELITTNYEGMQQSIKMSAFVRFLVSTPTLLTEAEKAKRAANFADKYLGKDSVGVAYLDAAQQVVQLDTSKGKYAGHEVMAMLEQKIYNYLGINQKIIDATFNEDDWQSYYESSLEPLVMKLSAQLTQKLLTQREIEFGNKIVVDANRLQTASLKTRLMAAQTLQKSPIHRPNDVNKLLYIDPIEGGDEPFIFLNYQEKDLDNKSKPLEEKPDVNQTTK